MVAVLSITVFHSTFVVVYYVSSESERIETAIYLCRKRLQSLIAQQKNTCFNYLFAMKTLYANAQFEFWERIIRLASLGSGNIQRAAEFLRLTNRQA